MIAKVLLVDDESPFVEALAKRLKLRELEVAIALSGPEALEKLEQNSTTDVVVLDVKMPGMDGIETLKAIKARYPLIEVIMLTGHATVESAIDGMKVGALDYLMKPCDMDVLMAKVARRKTRRPLRRQRLPKLGL